MYQKSKKFAVLISIFCIPLVINATNFYVDNQASGSNNGTSWANAWSSFSNINWGSINPGDVIYISGGSSSKTYNEMLDVQKDGSSGNPITITKGVDAGHNGTVILDGQMSLLYGVRIESDDYITVENLKIQNYIDRGQVRVRYCSNAVVENNTLYATSHGGVYLRGTSNTVVKNNTITTPVNLDAQTDGIYSELSSNNRYEGNSIVISNQSVPEHIDGIQMYRENNMTIKNNYIEQNNSKTYNAQGIYCTESSGTINISNNIVYAPNTNNSLIALRNLDIGTAKLTAYHNTLVGGNYGTLRVSNSPNSEIKNNILVSNKSGAATIRLDPTFPGAANVDYNVHYAPNSDGMAILDASGKTWQEWRNNGFDANGYYGNPLLSGYTPQSGSPAMDHGIDLGASYTWAKNGVTRPQGSGVDIGAHEAPQTSETISKPGTPTGNLAPVKDNAYTYSTTGAASSEGHTVEYQFNWGDGTSSSWSTSLSASHTWSSTGSQNILITARCQSHTDRNNISDQLVVTVTEPPIAPSNLRVQ